MDLRWRRCRHRNLNPAILMAINDMSCRVAMYVKIADIEGNTFSRHVTLGEGFRSRFQILSLCRDPIWWLWLKMWPDSLGSLPKWR
jgi:hypothetical protein